MLVIKSADRGLHHIGNVKMCYIYIAKLQNQQHYKPEMQNTIIKLKNVPGKESGMSMDGKQGEKITGHEIGVRTLYACNSAITCKSLYLNNNSN